jgi:predicted metal-dependent hydrolase
MTSSNVVPIGNVLPAQRLYAPEVSDTSPAAYRQFWQLWSEQKFFECHEVLEDLWRETSGELRLFYNGLIHCAVAIYQHRNGNAEGAARQLVRAQVKLLRFAPEYSGVDVGALLGTIEHEIQASLDALNTRQQARLLELRRIVSKRTGNETGSQAEE